MDNLFPKGIIMEWTSIIKTIWMVLMDIKGILCHKWDKIMVLWEVKCYEKIIEYKLI